jgi:hypothetical protein
MNMKRFVNGTDQAFADLERRAKGTCVLFRDVELPPGTLPARAKVGFEVKSSDGAAVLFVDHGISYQGSNQAVACWLQAGEIRFSGFGQLKQWLRHEVGACYRSDSGSVAPQTVPADSQVPRSPRELTDIVAIQAATPDLTGAMYLAEDDLFRELSTRVRAQDEALRLLARRVCRHVARKAPIRPATIFAVGPTAVGKTKTAESLPAALRALDPSGAGYSYLRLDMSEYQEHHRMSQLLGAPQGYVGYGEGAQLTDALSANPRTIVHFDEIEKAHPKIFQALMNAMDAGRLTTPAAGSTGRRIDCRAAFFIFTSNLDSTGILEDLESRNAFGNRAVVDQVCRNRLRAAGLAPELVSRIGCFLVFRPLTTEARVEIITLAITRVAGEYGLHVVRIAPSVVTYLLEQARSDGFGARPDEYLVDDVLGECFSAVARDMRGSVKVIGGPPFNCVPADVEEASRSDSSPLDIPKKTKPG